MLRDTRHHTFSTDIPYSRIPIVRPDGSIFDKSGERDEVTNLKFLPCSDEFRSLLADPSLDQARAEMGKLFEPLGRFLASDQDRMAWLALFLTIIARPAIQGPVPLFHMNAEEESVGQSVFMRATAAMAGLPLVNIALPDDDELRRLVRAVLMADAPLACIKVYSKQQNDALSEFAQVITDDVVSATENDGGLIELQSRTVWCSSGVNVMLPNDLQRRGIGIRIKSDDPKAKPLVRYSFLQELGDKRADSITSGLTIVRAWFHHGSKRRPQRHWGQFSEWEDIIPSICSWLDDRTDVMDARLSKARRG